MVSRRTTDRGFGATLTTSIDAQPGSLELDVQFEGDDAPSGSYTIRAGFNGLNQAASRFNRFIGDIRNNLGGGRNFELAARQLPFDVPTNRSEIIPSDFRQFRDGLVQLDSFNLQPSIGPQGPPQGGGGFGFFPLQTQIPEVGGAQVNRRSSRDFNWRPIPIPNAPNLDINPPSLPSFTLVVEVVRTERLQPRRTWRTRTSISSDILFEERDVSGQLDCLSIHQDIERRIDRLASRVSAPRSSIRSGENRLENIKESIEQADRNARSALSADIGDIVSEIGQNRVQDLRRESGQINVNVGDLRNLESEFRNLRNEIQNTGRCSEELLNQLEDKVGNIPDLLDRAGRIQSEASRLRDLLGATGQVRCRVQFESIARQVRRVEDDAGLGSDRIPTTFDRLDEAIGIVRDARGSVQANIPADNRCRNEFEARLDRVESRFRRRLTDPGASGLDCEDIDQGVRTIVSNFEDRSREFTAQSFEDRRPAKRAELLADQTRILNTIRTNVNDLNPCKSQLLNRVRTAVSQVQGAEAIPEFQLECTDRFEDIGNRLDSFEEQVLNLEAPVGPEEFQEVSSEGGEIISMIEEATEPETECREEFIDRTRALIDRAERLGARVRITTRGDSEAQERREQLLGEILGSLERLERERGSGGERVREGIEDQVQT